MNQPCPRCGQIHSTKEVQEHIGEELNRLKEAAEADIDEVIRLAGAAQQKYERCAELFIGEDISDTAKAVLRIIGTVRGLVIFAESIRETFANTNTDPLLDDLMEAMAEGRVQVIPLRQGANDA